MPLSLHLSRHPLIVLLVVVAGLAAVAALAHVVAAVVPAAALFSSATLVFFGSGRFARSLLPELVWPALFALVVGGGWAFGAWCRIDALALWPPLLVAAGAGALVALAGATLGPPPVRLGGDRPGLQVAVAVLMALSWIILRRGVVGVVLSCLFCVWGLLRLWATVAASRETEPPLLCGVAILDVCTELGWNALVLWLRLLPDDDDGGAGAALGLA
jgi:hypothetical protein